MNKLRSIVADVLVISGVGISIFGAYETWGLGVTCLLAGPTFIIVGVSLGRTT